MVTETGPCLATRQPFWKSHLGSRRGTPALGPWPPREGFASVDLLVQWLQDLHLRRRMRVPEEIYAAALEAQTRAAAGGVPGWRGALQLLQVMQDRKLEVRAAACTAAMHACCKQDLDEVEPARAVMDLFQQMLSWSVRPYDGTLAAVVKSESKLGTWPQALWRLELIRGRGISKLVRSYTAAAEACEASEACDWERSMQLVEISQERSRREADKFLERTFPPAITALSRGAHWHLALHAHRRLQRLPRGARMTVKAYTELIRACGQGPSWSEVLGLLDEMYLAKLSPSPETFEAVAEALASRGSCGDTSEASAWIVQLDEELQLNNLRPTPRMSELAMEARRSLGMTEEFELGTDLIEESL
ncbi:Hypothetical protein SCF082_LOCUS1510 [Durusdinium trenchii]